MAEQIDLVSNDKVSAGTPNYYVSRLLLDWDGARIDVTLNSSIGISRTFSYTGVTATNFMKALNTANLALKSLHKRILEKLATDGFLSGSISGTPD